MQKQHLVVFVTAMFFAILLGTWLILDHRLPNNDEAGHILNSYTYTDLLRHPKFWQSAWLYKFLTVNQFYPPAVHIFNGMLRLLIGRGRQSDIISLTIFNLILAISTYGIARLLTGSLLAGILAIVCVNVYPNLNFLSHHYLLDYPLVAMISLGLFALVWWKEAPSVKRALITGAILGLACMTKQIAVCYLIVLCFAYLIQGIRTDWQSRKFFETKQMAIIGFITSVICLPWLYFNAGIAHQTTNQLASEINQADSVPTFFSNLSFYLTSLPHMMSVALFILFLFSLLMPPHIKRLSPIGLTALGGMLLISSLTWIFPKEQYLAPLLVIGAIYSAAGLITMLQAQSNWPKLIGSSLIIFSLLQFFVANFTPYPLQLGSLAAQLSDKQAYANNPRPREDWGTEWVLNQIDRIDKRQVNWLNILSDSPEINVHTFEYMVAKLGSKVKPTTSRYYTVIGDRLDFSPKQALYCQWYLFRSGEKGFPLKDAASRLNYSHLTNFVRSSGHFYRVGQKPLPDGTVLSLYHQK